MSASFSVLPLNQKEEVRPGTRRPSTCARAFRISSATPSAKYSWSLPGLMSAKGRTAIEGGTAGAAGPACRSANQATPAPISAPTTTRARAGRPPAHLPAVPGVAPSAGPVRSIPFRVRSNAQARPAVTGKPTASTATTTLSTHSFRSSARRRGSMTCSTAKENRPQASRARMTRRRLSSWSQAARSTDVPSVHRKVQPVEECNRGSPWSGRRARRTSRPRETRASRGRRGRVPRTPRRIASPGPDAGDP